MKNLLITGYRAHELGIFDQKHKGIPYIQKAIMARVVPLIEDGLEWIITPGQYGVDLWACEALIELKKQYPHIQISIITAFLNPEEKWKDDKKQYYAEILRGIDYYAAASKQPYTGAWQFTSRDDFLLRKTDGIILVYDEEAGEASPRFIKEKALLKQKKDGYRFIGIGMEEIQSVASESEYVKEWPQEETVWAEYE